MEEIWALQKQLAEAQMQDSVRNISERNCIEIILKLIEDQRIKLIYTQDGKEVSVVFVYGSVALWSCILSTVFVYFVYLFSTLPSM